MAEARIKIRWRDMDAYGHVNNAVYLNFLEEARDRLTEELFGAADAWSFVLAHVGIDFRSELTQDDGTITVRCEVTGYGASSVQTREVVVKADGTIAAESESVLVPRNAEGTGSRPLTDRERDVLQAAAARSADRD